MDLAEDDMADAKSMRAEHQAHSAPWQRLAFPLILIAIGAAIVSAATIAAANADNICSIMLGVLASMAALAIWIAYGRVSACKILRAD